MSDRDLVVPNEHDLDPQMALESGEVGSEPPLEPIEDPEHQDYVVPASDAVPAPEGLDPNVYDLDPQMALEPGEVGSEPPLEPIEDPEHQDYVVPAPDAVPAPEGLDQ